MNLVNLNCEDKKEIDKEKDKKFKHSNTIQTIN